MAKNQDIKKETVWEDRLWITAAFGFNSAFY